MAPFPAWSSSNGVASKRKPSLACALSSLDLVRYRIGRSGAETHSIASHHKKSVWRAMGETQGPSTRAVSPRLFQVRAVWRLPRYQIGHLSGRGKTDPESSYQKPNSAFCGVAFGLSHGHSNMLIAVSRDVVGRRNGLYAACTNFYNFLRCRLHVRHTASYTEGRPESAPEYGTLSAFALGQSNRVSGRPRLTCELHTVSGGARW